MDLLVSWIQSPDPTGPRGDRRALPFFLAVGAQQRGATGRRARTSRDRASACSTVSGLAVGGAPRPGPGDSDARRSSLCRLDPGTRRPRSRSSWTTRRSAIETGIKEPWQDVAAAEQPARAPAHGNRGHRQVRSWSARCTCRPRGGARRACRRSSGVGGAHRRRPRRGGRRSSRCSRRTGCRCRSSGPRSTASRSGRAGRTASSRVDVDLGDDERDATLAALGWTVVTMDIDDVAQRADSRGAADGDRHLRPAQGRATTTGRSRSRRRLHPQALRGRHPPGPAHRADQERGRPQGAHRPGQRHVPRGALQGAGAPAGSRTTSSPACGRTTRRSRSRRRRPQDQPGQRAARADHGAPRCPLPAAPGRRIEPARSRGRAVRSLASTSAGVSLRAAHRRARNRSRARGTGDGGDVGRRAHGARRSRRSSGRGSHCSTSRRDRRSSRCASTLGLDEPPRRRRPTTTRRSCSPP